MKASPWLGSLDADRVGDVPRTRRPTLQAEVPTASYLPHEPTAGRRRASEAHGDAPLGRTAARG